MKVGDYVNGESVLQVYFDKRYGKIVMTQKSQLINGTIDSVLTKEQFSEMEYRL